MSGNAGVYSAFRFVVKFEGLEVAGFSEVSGLEFEIPPIEYRTGDGADLKITKMPGLPKYANITLKRGITTNDEFWSWIASAPDGEVEKRDGEIELLNEAREPVARWQFAAGWPCKYQGPELNATASEIAFETVEIAHEGLRLSN
ncbi:MAG: phage tail protein [Actinomycetota bacterium]|nr:phage tail protein [Actinomycetota bacterium]